MAWLHRTPSQGSKRGFWYRSDHSAQTLQQVAADLLAQANMTLAHICSPPVRPLARRTRCHRGPVTDHPPAEVLRSAW